MSTQKLDLKFLKRSLRDRLFYSRVSSFNPREDKPMPLENQAKDKEFDAWCNRHISW